MEKNCLIFRLLNLKFHGEIMQYVFTYLNNNAEENNTIDDKCFENVM
jgi:hypothetical protein